MTNMCICHAPLEIRTDRVHIHSLQLCTIVLPSIEHTNRNGTSWSGHRLIIYHLHARSLNIHLFVQYFRITISIGAVTSVHKHTHTHYALEYEHTQPLCAPIQGQPACDIIRFKWASDNHGKKSRTL